MEWGSLRLAFDQLRPVCGGCGDAAGSRVSGDRPASASLENFQNTVTPIGSDRCHEVRKCPCDTWFCPDCTQRKGYSLRARLIPVLESFGGVLMLSLTVDPQLFGSPRDAFNYIHDSRAVARLVAALHKRGYLRSRRYFYVVEWQQGTELPHWHVLVDAAYVPHDVAMREWGKFRPADAPQWRSGSESSYLDDDKRPRFGYVWISRHGKFKSALHAGRYVTKYLTKWPRGGFPAWVLDMGVDRRIRRFSTSRGFWGDTEPRPPAVNEDEETAKRETSRSSYYVRALRCGETVTVFRRVECVDESTGETFMRREFVARLALPFAYVEVLERAEGIGKRGRLIAARSFPELLTALEFIFGQRPRVLAQSGRVAA